MNRRSFVAAFAGLLAAARGRAASAQTGICAPPGGGCSAAVPCCAGTCAGSTPFGGTCVTGVRSPLPGLFGGGFGAGDAGFTAGVRGVIQDRERTLERRDEKRSRAARERGNRRYRLYKRRSDRRFG